MKYNPQTRIQIISVGLVLVVIFFIVRLFFLQIVKGDDYDSLADRQYINSGPTAFERGTIYFTEKTGTLVPAATLKQTFSILADTQLILNAEQVYQELAKVLTLDQAVIAQLADKNRRHQLIVKDLNREQAEAITKLNLRGIAIKKEKIRYYPAGPTASHVIGLMAYQGENYAGQYGLEKEFDQVLNRDKNVSFASFIAELFLGFGKTITQGHGQVGDIELTIEPLVQSQLEDKLEELVTTWQVEQAGGIIMDPQTGEILAMAAKPDFDPGQGVDDINLLTNPLIERVYEMGSVVKALTMAIGLDTGVVTPETTYYDAGFITLNNRRIANHDGKARGQINMQEVLNQSLNTGAAFVADKVGHRRFGDYLLNFGLGEKTGIDLPGEIRGLNNLHSNQPVEYATASFGQGIAVTPIEITRAFAVLANGGKLVRPHVVKKINYEDGVDLEITPTIDRQVISTSTAKSVTAMLIKIVDTVLVGGKYNSPHHSIAVKTGTAQIVDKKTGRYYDDRFLHSFFGYFPATNPRFVSFIYIINPRGARYASETLSAPFMDLTQFLLNYYEVPPDR